jgi:voltage-gated potassium channel
MINHVKIFFLEIKSMFTSPTFLFLSILGNGFIFICSLIFYHIEYGINPKVIRYMDALWWSFATATTTGYGDITPITDAGKILSIILMLAGLALFAMYTALFAETILTSRKKLNDQI